MERNKHKLNKNKSQRAVNEDGYQPISLENESRLLPFNDITRIINENEQFNKERQESKKYRIVATINGLFSNPLFNVSGENSWSTFNEALFRDRSYPPNGISINEAEDFTFLESVDHHLKEENGWFGYYSPKLNESNRFLFTNMKPGRNELDLITNSGMNWDITFTYPAEKLSNDNTKDGLDIIGKKQVLVSGKKMTALLLPYKHNVQVGDTVRLTGIGKDGDYDVRRIGLDNGDLKDNYFVIDLPLTSVELNKGKFQKIVNGNECEYYFRLFKRVNTIKGEAIGDKDYDAFPLAFSKNIYGDPMVQVVSKNDIDVTALVDNLGRPVTEIYVTYIKKANKGFSKVSSGLLVNNLFELKERQDIPDIRRIHNGGEKPFKSSTPINDEVNFSDETFVGDLVEYDKTGVVETVISEVYHRFNTTNREAGAEIQTVLSRGDEVNIEDVAEYLKDAPIWHGLTPSDIPTIDNISSPIIMFALFSDQNLTQNEQFEDGSGSGGGGGTSGGGFYYTPIYLGYNASTSTCSISGGLRRYMNSSSFSSATALFKDSSGSTREIKGYYTDANITRFWDGYKFTTTTTCGSSVSPTCVSIRATHNTSNVPNGSTFIGGNCVNTLDDSEQTEYFFKDNFYYIDYRAGGSNTSCNYSTQMIGTAIDSFQYNGTTITTNSTSAIRLIKSNHIVNGKTYNVYVKWNNIYDDRMLTMEDPYMVCTSVEEENPAVEGPVKGNVNLGSRQEGYLYKPFHKIQIREFSNYIESGDETIDEIPSYAVKMDDGRYIWRDIMDIGFSGDKDGVDYPFLNGSHHLYVSNVLSLKRQDPFSEIGLRATGLIADVRGNKLNDKRKINKSGDVC